MKQKSRRRTRDAFVLLQNMKPLIMVIENIAPNRRDFCMIPSVIFFIPALFFLAGNLEATPPEWMAF